MTDRLRVLIVEDEPLVRQMLVEMLKHTGRVEVVGEAGNLTQARKLVSELRLDAVFLDIQLRGEDGFDLLPNLPAGMPVIFVTAYDNYAVRAFEVNALDYLVKPASLDRVELAVSRLVRQAAATPSTIPGQLTNEDRVLATSGNRRFFIDVQEIRAICAWGDYTEVYAQDGEQGLVHRTMKSWQSNLPPDQFVRIHRGTIINTAYLEKLERRQSGILFVTLSGLSKEFDISRRMSSTIKERLTKLSRLSK